MAARLTRYVVRRGRRDGGPWLWLAIFLKLRARSKKKKAAKAVVYKETLAPDEAMVLTNVPNLTRRDKRAARRG